MAHIYSTWPLFLVTNGPLAPSFQKLCRTLPLFCDLIPIVLWSDSHCFMIWFPLFCDLIPIVLWSDSHCFMIWFPLFCDLIPIVLRSDYHCFVIWLRLFCDQITIVLWSDYSCFVIWLPLFCEIHFQLLDMTVFHLTFVYYSKHSTFP